MISFVKILEIKFPNKINLSLIEIAHGLKQYLLILLILIVNTYYNGY